MTKKTTAIFLSVLIAVMPFLGLPTQFKTYFFLISGLLLVGLIELISIQYCKKCGELINYNKEELDKYEDPEISEVSEDENKENDIEEEKREENTEEKEEFLDKK